MSDYVASIDKASCVPQTPLAESTNSSQQQLFCGQHMYASQLKNLAASWHISHQLLQSAEGTSFLSLLMYFHRGPMMLLLEPLVKSIVASHDVKDAFYQQLQQQLEKVANANLLLLKHLHHAEMRFDRLQTFLSLSFQLIEHISELP